MDMTTWPLEINAMVFPGLHRMPTDSDMDVDTAILRAKEALMSAYGFDESFFDDLTAYVMLSQGIWNHEKATNDYEYHINFDAVDQKMVCGVLMISDTGEILETYWHADGKIPSVG